MAEVLASLDRRYIDPGKPQIYFLKPTEPITPHIEELLRPNSDGLDAGELPPSGGAHADAVVFYEFAMELMAHEPEPASAKLMNRMNRAAALRELGLADQARDKPRKLLPEIERLPATESLMKGHARYHLASASGDLATVRPPSGPSTGPSPHTTVHPKQTRSLPPSAGAPRNSRRS